MSDTSTPAAAETPVQPSKIKSALIAGAKAVDTAFAYVKAGFWAAWNSGALKKSITVPAKAFLVGALLIIGASLFVKIIHKAAPVVAETVGIEAPEQCSPKIATLPKAATPAAKKPVLKPAKARKETQSLGFFN